MVEINEAADHFFHLLEHGRRLHSIPLGIRF